jgi:hypothetical protein
VGQDCFAIGGDEADVAAIFACSGELEISFKEAYQQRAAIAGGCGELRSIESDLLALGPIFIPPCGFVLGDEVGA